MRSAAILSLVFMVSMLAGEQALAAARKSTPVYSCSSSSTPTAWKKKNCKTSSTTSGGTSTSGGTTSGGTTTTPAQPVTYTAKLSWVIPSTRENGAALALSDLSGYEIYYTTSDPAVTGTVAINGGSTAAYALANLSAGTYYFAISAIDASGIKSALSTVVTVKFGS